MKPQLFEIDESIEATLRLFLQEEQRLISARGGPKKTPGGDYQLWSVTLNNKEVFWYGVGTQSNGRQTMFVSPLVDKGDKKFYLSFLSKLKSTGARQLESI